MGGAVAIPDVVDRVAAIVRETADQVIVPRWRRLQDGEVRSKSPGELVTVADEEAEQELTRRLHALSPGVPVVGEEATSADPSVRNFLKKEQAWLVDPIDGTSNFVDGGDRWSVMVALVVDGQTRLSWIWQPPTGRLYVAERSNGATRDGEVLRRAPRAAGARLRGSAFTRFFDATRAERIWEGAPTVGEVVEGTAAGYDYPLFAEGDRDFLLFWRTLPWDHAPGTLLAAESGGFVRRIDGSEYRPGQDAFGLAPAADAEVWRAAAALPG
jgi:fructose-1,6-bisphosphatase/inositol monophosphatase family enzyme